MHRFLVVIGFVIGSSIVTGCGSGENSTDVSPPDETGAIILSSTAFKAGEPIPEKHTEDGEDLSPPLSWTGVPDKAKSIALICDDPDAPMEDAWVHWVIYNLPPDTNQLPEGIGDETTLDEPDGAIQGINDFMTTGYRGPAPPKGKPHRYFFKIFALDTMLDLDGDKVDKRALMKAIVGHVMEQGELVGTYQR